MNAVFYDNTTLWVIFVDVVVALATIWLFKIGGAKRTTLYTVSTVFVLAIALMHWIFGGQNLLPSDLSGAAFYGIILGGCTLALTGLLLTSSKVFDRLSQVHLQLAQGLRVYVGAGFLMEGVVNVIPGWFSILDGYFHIVSGFLALVAAIALLQQWKSSRLLLWSANIVGLADIITIVTGICFWAWEDLGPHHNMNYVVFGAGPILLWIHYNSIKKLLQNPSP